MRSAPAGARPLPTRTSGLGASENKHSGVHHADSAAKEAGFRVTPPRPNFPPSLTPRKSVSQIAAEMELLVKGVQAEVTGRGLGPITNSPGLRRSEGMNDLATRE